MHAPAPDVEPVRVRQVLEPEQRQAAGGGRDVLRGRVEPLPQALVEGAGQQAVPLLGLPHVPDQVVLLEGRASSDDQCV